MKCSCKLKHLICKQIIFTFIIFLSVAAHPFTFLTSLFLSGCFRCLTLSVLGQRCDLYRLLPYLFLISAFSQYPEHEALPAWLGGISAPADLGWPPRASPCPIWLTAREGLSLSQFLATCSPACLKPRETMTPHALNHFHFPLSYWLRDLILSQASG